MKSKEDKATINNAKGVCQHQTNDERYLRTLWKGRRKKYKEDNKEDQDKDRNNN